MRSTFPRPTKAPEAGEAGDECILDSKSSNTRRSGGSGVCRRRRCCAERRSRLQSFCCGADQSPTALGYASAGRRRRCLAGSCEKKQIAIHICKRSARRSGARLTLTSHEFLEFCILGSSCDFAGLRLPSDDSSTFGSVIIAIPAVSALAVYVSCTLPAADSAELFALATSRPSKRPSDRGGREN